MDNQQWQVAKKVAATYIGTVVGAGFATGREIVEFFTVNGFYGTIGICVSGFFYLAWHKNDVTLLANRCIFSTRNLTNTYLGMYLEMLQIHYYYSYYLV